MTARPPVLDKIMWLNDTKKQAALDNDTDDDDDSLSNSGEEVPIWVRGEQRFVSGINTDTTCQDVIQVLLHDEENRGRHIGSPDQYHITERWRGVEQPLDHQSVILDIWTAWGTAQPEVKFSLRRIKYEIRPPSSRRTRCKSDASTWSDKSAWKTIHPKRLHALQNEKQPSSTEELLKLVLAQGEVIRRQLKKLRHSEHQIGYLEDKTHKARVRKHGSNYLLETYLKGLSEAVDPERENNSSADKNSDSGVMTEGDSEQSNTNKPSRSSAETSFERFSPSSEEFSKDLKDDDTSSTVSEATVREQIELFEAITKLNKRLLKEEECLVRLDANLRKYDKHKASTEDLAKALTNLRTEMAKSACEMQHNEVVLEETVEMIGSRRHFLENLHRDLANEEQEHEMLQTLMYSSKRQRHHASSKTNTNNNNNNNTDNSCSLYYSHTKELLDTLV